MEEQTSWKGHSFTLLVFTGIVVLCSIFFILGMLVGRNQGHKLAAAEAEEELSAELKPIEEDAPELTFYESVEDQELLLEEPVVTRSDPAPEKPKPVTPALSANAVSFQITAVRKSADAEKLVADLKKKNFRAFIVPPSAKDPNPLFRVQVGPFAVQQEAELAKRRLETAGYKIIVKR